MAKSSTPPLPNGGCLRIQSGGTLLLCHSAGAPSIGWVVQDVQGRCVHRTERTMNATRTTLGATSTTDDVLGSMTLHGKRVLVTGVSAGLGIETARALAARGAEVVGTARDV